MCASGTKRLTTVVLCLAVLLSIMLPAGFAVAAPNTNPSSLMEICLRNNNVKTFVVWGFTDKYSWIPSTFPGTGRGLIYDSNYNQKPAYTALKQALMN